MSLIKGVPQVRSPAEVDGNSWPAVLSIAFAAFLVITTELLPVGLLNNVSDDFHIRIGTAGWMIATPGILAAFAAPLLTLTANGIDRRKLLICFVLLLSVANTVVALAPSFSIVLLGRALLGLSVGGFWSFAVSVGRRLVSEAAGGRATAVILSGVSIGAVVSASLGTVLGSTIGWRFAFGGVAVLAALAAAAQFFLLRTVPQKEVVTPHALLNLFAIPSMRVGFAVTALTAAGHFAAYSYLDPFLTVVAVFTPARRSWTFLVYGLFGIVGTYAGERYAAKNLRRTLLCITAGMGLVIMMTAANASHVSSLVISIAVWGMAFGAVPVCTQIWTFRAAPRGYEAASSVGIGTFQIALAFGSYLGGTAVDHAGIRAALFLGTIFTFCCSILILRSIAPLSA